MTTKLSCTISSYKTFICTSVLKKMCFLKNEIKTSINIVLESVTYFPHFPFHILVCYTVIRLHVPISRIGTHCLNKKYKSKDTSLMPPFFSHPSLITDQFCNIRTIIELNLPFSLTKDRCTIVCISVGVSGAIELCHQILA